jgi:glutamate synthase (NADPH/NADH) large chain
MHSSLPAPSGLYDPRFEHDACGVSFVANIKGVASRDIVATGIGALCNMEHRGATGAEADSGDGAGILVQVPDRFLRAVVDFPLPAAGAYAVGLAFLPADPTDAEKAQAGVEAIVADEGLTLLGWRDVPVNPDCLGATARAVMPSFRQLFLSGPAGESGVDLDRLLFVVRKRIEHELPSEQRTYFPSLGSRTLIYKGMFTTPQLGAFFPDLADERFESALALVHSRFSTNTFPSWPLAHPYRYIAHNGEINTVQGNRNWMRTRESLLASDLLPGLERAFPICTPGGSDSATFDEVLELLHLGGRSLAHAMLMMIPEAWENHDTMDAEKRAFYRFHSSLMEPWDGPASVCFTDGSVIGAVLDRNGLRPSRYWVTDDDRVVLASEVGVIDIDQAKVVRKGRLQPGRMFLIDTVQGRIVEDDEVKRSLAQAEPYQQWLTDGLVELGELPEREHVVFSRQSVLRRQQMFGYTHEELKIILAPMAKSGLEPIGSMGTDTPIAVLSERSRLLFDYFVQLFAQVTNPPLDAIREEVVTSVGSTVGPEANLLAPGPESCRQLVLPFPVIDNDELAKIIHINDDGDYPELAAIVISGLYRVAGGGLALKRALDAACSEVSKAIADGARIVVLSDRNSDEVYAPIPSLLLTSAVHHHLIREKQRTKAGLVVECGDAREVHHMALLVGYGAGAINPYLAFESIEDMVREDLHGLGGIDPHKAQKHYIKAAGKGVLKVMSKMGVSTVASYTGAQIFEAIGLGHELVDEYFTGTVSRLGGIGLDEIAKEVAVRHAAANPRRPEERAHRKLELGGEYQWRREGDIHLFNPETVFKLQHATRSKRYDIFQQYTSMVNGLSAKAATLRGLFDFRSDRPAVPLDEVEPVSAIVKRFSTGAMSYGSISAEAHETLAVAMNSIGAKSNTGEGGEDADRLHDPQRRSAIKQVASGRFGVTSEYLVNADDLQIKMAQGAKPGEGGQLPGHKVYPWVAKTRHSTPGVGLISPPPHHDIYSIEDLKQLIHDLKNSNPLARVHVKLVAEVGVGTVAAGVSKAKADVVLISGHDGGTGASPLTSLKHAGGPWELGLAETQQTLLLNGLRDRIVVQADGQLKTGRDVVIAALLGAESYGFGTGPLVAIGCDMARQCHLNSCPTGIATQKPELRAKFRGNPDQVVAYFTHVAQQVREILASVGARSLDEIIGSAERLQRADRPEVPRSAMLDLSLLLTPAVREDEPRKRTLARNVRPGVISLDELILRDSADGIAAGTPFDQSYLIKNHHLAVGSRVAGTIADQYGDAGLPSGTFTARFKGSAGQSFGAFTIRGMRLDLEGEANDYVGKGLNGGEISVRPFRNARYVGASHLNMIVGNTVLYGATDGLLLAAGQAGDRFAVRNSGACAVVEGVGNHACEYMTGGVVAVLGRAGRNFGAGMSNGLAYVLDEAGTFASRVNHEMVLLSELDVDDLMLLERLLQIHYDRTGSARARAIMEAPDKAFGEWRKVKPRGAAEPVALIRQAWIQRLQALIDADGDAAPRVMQRG